MMRDTNCLVPATDLPARQTFHDRVIAVDSPHSPKNTFEFG
jgi:hypothetical protein